MKKEFEQIQWDDQTVSDCLELIHLAVREDTRDTGDLTTASLVPQSVRGSAAVVSREAGVAAGLRTVPMILKEINPLLWWTPDLQDGDPLEKGTRLGRISGPAACLLIAERLVLNFLGRLCGIASHTSEYVKQTEGTKAQVYSTRKTTPGWRRLEKLAVRAGGGFNHRAGLHAAVLIKDNHLVLGSQIPGHDAFTPAEAVELARKYVAENLLPEEVDDVMIEIEVDTLEQLDEVLLVHPDIVLLDNMGPDRLREAVYHRDVLGISTQLEASGGVNMDTIRSIAESGVERISIGALTHSAISLDVGLDWE